MNDQTSTSGTDTKVTKMQGANLVAKDGELLTTVSIPAFPDNPDLVRLPDGRLFGNGLLGYGIAGVTYTECDTPYEATPITT